MSQDDERELSAHQEREISRLLAEAGGPSTTPPAVAARLETVLAELVAQRAPEEEAGPARVHPAARDEPRRSRWPRTLLAAAAVVVGGYGVGSVLQSGGLDGGDHGTSGAAGADAGACMAGEPPEPVPQHRGDAGGTSGAATAPPEQPRENALTPPRPARGPVRLSSDRLAQGVLRALRGGEPAPRVRRETTCAPPALAKGESWAPARYDGRRAVLVIRPAGARRVEATVYSCVGAQLAATTVRAP